MSGAADPVMAVKSLPAMPAAEGMTDVATRRARELLAFGSALVDELGRHGGEAMAAALPLMQRASDDTSELLALNRELVPLMNALRPPARRPAWWLWFTGERLEREVAFHDLQARIERLAQLGDRGLAALRVQVRALKEEDQAMARHIAGLEAEIAAGRLLLSPTWQPACLKAGLAQDDLARLARRAANLEAMATATQLTRAQYQVAVQHARSVADRFIETRSLLLPLWKQAMGFELFSQRVSTRIDEGS